MNKRFPFRTAIVGLSAIALITPAVTAPVDSTVIAAAIAQTTEAVTVTGDDTVNIKSSATFTATVPGATDGKVQFFLDGVLVATTDVNAQGIATAEITASSYGEHTITSRYVTTKDGEDYNLNPDGTTTFTTPLPTNYQMDDSGNTGTDADTYDRFQINRQTSSIDNPIELQPGDTYTLTGRMTTTSFNSRVYEVGINPAPGSTYVEGSAARYHANTTTPDTSVVVKTRADENGVATTETAGGYHPSGWGQTTDGQTWPTVNEGYVGLQSTSSYNSGRGTTWEIGANFIAPDVPGIHVPQYATYKYRSSLHVLVPMNEAAFKIAPKELPPRNEMPAEETTLTVAADKDTITDGDTSTLTATITPDNAAGTVQFKNNGENIGSPVQVENGTAELTHTLPLGTNNITADFTPENEAAFTPATAEATTVTVEEVPAEPSPTTSETSTSETTSEPTSEPTSETTSEDPTTTPTTVEPSPTTSETSTSETSETTSEPTSEPTSETTSEPTSTTKETAPTSESPTTTTTTEEPSPTTTETSTSETTSETTTSEPTTKPTSETTSETPTTVEPSPTTSETTTSETTSEPTSTTKETEPTSESPTTTTSETTTSEPTSTSKETEPSTSTTDNATATETTSESSSTPTTSTSSTEQPDAKKDKDKYEPEVNTSAKPETYEGGILPAPKKVITNIDSLPQGTSLKWTKLPSIADPFGQLTVTYPDGSTDLVKIEFTVKKQEGSSGSSSETSSEKPWIFVVIAATVSLLMGVAGFALGTNQQVRDFLEQQFGIRF